MIENDKQKKIVEKTLSVIAEIEDVLVHCNTYETILPAENIQAREIISVLKNKICNLGSEANDLLNFIDVKDQENPLTQREKQILEMVSEGMYNKEIAYQLNISEKTVQFHLKSVFSKLKANSRTEASTKAAKKGWINI